MKSKTNLETFVFLQTTMNTGDVMPRARDDPETQLKRAWVVGSSKRW
jgi:hypothetical protein